MSFSYEECTKKVSTKTKRQGKRLKAIKKNYIDKNKENVMILCEAGALYTVQGIFFDFHACNSRMYKSALSKNFPIFSLFFEQFCPFFVCFPPFLALFYPFLKKMSSCLRNLEYVH